MKIWDDWKELINDLAWFSFGAASMFVILLAIGLYYFHL